MPTFPLLGLASAANIAPDKQNRCWVPPHHLPRVQMAPNTGGLSRKALEAAITAVREVVAKFDLTVKDVFNATRKPSTSKGKKAPVKYRDAATGKTWSGRGLAPAGETPAGWAGNHRGRCIAG